MRFADNLPFPYEVLHSIVVPVPLATTGTTTGVTTTLGKMRFLQTHSNFWCSKLGNRCSKLGKTLLCETLCTYFWMSFADNLLFPHEVPPFIAPHPLSPTCCQLLCTYFSIRFLDNLPFPHEVLHSIVLPVPVATTGTTAGVATTSKKMRFL